MSSTHAQRDAHAKINLILKVGAPDGSGMHPVSTWMHPIGLKDRVGLTITGSGGIELDARWESGQPVAWSSDDDVCVKVLRELEREIGISIGARIEIVKSIPAGGGLGGGSSDAGAVLMMTNDAMGLGLGADGLRAIAHKVGSDIPFFIDPGHEIPRPGVVSGIGDRIERVGRIASPITLVVPPFGCATGGVYRALDSIGSFGAPDHDETARIARNGELSDPMIVNDLARPAIMVAPRLGDWIERMNSAGIRAHVSGSGSTIFAIGHRSREIGALALDGARIIETALV